MNRLRVALAVALALVAAASASAAVTLVDDVQRSVTLAAPARRIVTLAPFLTELVFSAGAGDRIVGVSAFSDYPSEAKKLPQVSSAAGLSLEQLAALKPDLVLAWNDSFRREDLERIEAFGAKVVVVRARSIDDVPRLLRLIGAATGRDVEAIATAYTKKVDDLRRANAAKPVVTAFLEVWHLPLTTISGKHFMNDALEICRARNIFLDLPGVAPEVSWEAVYARNPQVIVGAGSKGNEAEFRASWSQRPTLDAVKSNRLVYVDADTLQRPTTRMAEGIAQLCAGLDRVRK